MRLLRFDDEGQLAPPSDLTGAGLPRYAILSHTWRHDCQEVSFVDLLDRTAASKAGFDKIRFCGAQAKRDGIAYFWVDTCCIDRSNSSELQEAVNSMFAWYRDAAKCYVFLGDVSHSAPLLNKERNESAWEAAFAKSRWFTRGWTLQELIAPAEVEFFSKEGTHLGSKRSLESAIRAATGIPARALRGDTLSGFSVSERLAWAESRHTTRQEDKAYSLLGIFGISMPLIYGEGGPRAYARLRATIDEAYKGRHIISVLFWLHAAIYCGKSIN